MSTFESSFCAIKKKIFDYEPFDGNDEVGNLMVHIITTDEETGDVDIIKLRVKEAYMSFYMRDQISRQLDLLKNDFTNWKPVNILIPTKFSDKYLSKMIGLYMSNHYNNLPKPISFPINDENSVCTFDQWFIKMIKNRKSKNGRSQFVKVLEMADYLDIPHLIELLCALIAYVNRGYQLNHVLKMMNVDKKLGQVEISKILTDEYA